MIINYSHIESKGRALDVGSGPFPCMYKGYEWIHMDPFLYPHVEIIGVGTSIPFPDKYFDYVRNSCVIEHIDPNDHLLFMQEMKRVLKSGGFLETVVGDLDNYIANCKKREVPWYLVEIEVAKLVNGVDGPGMKHECLCTINGVLDLYKEVGLEVVSVDNVSRAPRDVVIIGRVNV